MGQLYLVSEGMQSMTMLNSPFGYPITQAQGSQLIPWAYSPGKIKPDFQEWTDNFMLQLDNATCTTSWMGVTPDGTQFP
jgi:hypothetical protein